MNFGKITEEMNTDEAKKIVDSILNVNAAASIVIDRATFEIIYENRKAVELIGNHVERLCYDVICTSDVPCLDCPIATMKRGTTAVRERYEELLDAMVTWQYTSIEWFDGRDAVLATITSIGEKASDDMESLMEQAATIMVEKSEGCDSLTGIPSRSCFYEYAQKAVEDIHKKYAIIVFDVEHFKNINDLYGILEGDLALKHIADSLIEIFGEQDNYARLHSDMFAFYMVYEGKGDIIKTIEKLRKRINTNDFPFELMTKFGIYLVNDSSIPVNLMCDRAMIAERTVKGNIMKFCAFYDEHYREEMLRAGQIEHDMERALRENEYKMYLQPKYRLSDNSLCGAEVLCRWLHPQKGLIPPNDFIPLFEKNGFILKLDVYMWEEACKTIRKWMDEGRNIIPISVNISRYHIHHNNLEGTLMSLIQRYDISPDMLNLEITESMFLDNPEEMNRELKRLQDLGFKLEVDDFGSGFSSLNMIRNISADTIKIDREFLDSEIATEKGKIVVSHAIGMAKDLNMQVVAEGVETKEHVEFLKASHCDIAQGFYFAKPMPLDEFEKMAFA